MSTAAGRPPDLSKNALSHVVRKYFNFSNVHEDCITTFPGYDDRNYYFEGENLDGVRHEFILKLFNPLHCTLSELKGINEMMRLIQSCGIVPQCPQDSRAGPDVIQLYHREMVVGDACNDSVTSVQERNGVNGGPDISTTTDELFCYASVLSFAHGEMFDHVEKKYLTPDLLHEVGVMLAKMDKELMDKFSNEAIESRENREWNLLYFLDMRKHLHTLDDPVKAETILNAFEKYVTPNLPNFRKSVIHGDANGWNIILGGGNSEDGKSYCYASFIDFGDSSKTCTVFDLGMCLAYIMMENLRPVTCSNVLEFVRPLIRGYNRVLPLSAEELDCLYYLVLARCCQSAINGEVCFKKEPWNKYLLTTVRKSWLLVDELLDMSKESVDLIWLRGET